MMAAHRGSMHKSAEHAANFTSWYIAWGHTIAPDDKLRMVRDTITDCMVSLWNKEEPMWWSRLFVIMWDALTENEKRYANSQVAYRNVVGESTMMACTELSAQCKDGLPATNHPLEGQLGQAMLSNIHDYCLGRMTYMPECCMRWLDTWWHYVDLGTRIGIVQSTGLALLKNRAGHTCDAVAWHAFFKKHHDELSESHQIGVRQSVIGEAGCTDADFNNMLAGDVTKAITKW